MRFIGREEERSTAGERDHVEEKQAETADISRIELVQLTHKLLLPTQSC